MSKYRYLDKDGKSYILTKVWDNGVIGRFTCPSIKKIIILGLNEVEMLKQPQLVNAQLAGVSNYASTSQSLANFSQNLGNKIIKRVARLSIGKRLIITAFLLSFLFPGGQQGGAIASQNSQNIVKPIEKTVGPAVIQSEEFVEATPKPVYAPLPADGYKRYIYQAESGNNPSSVNRYSGACGLGQALPCSKMPCSLRDYNCQDNFFTGYMLSRYGSWYNAYVFWINHRYW